MAAERAFPRALRTQVKCLMETGSLVDKALAADGNLFHNLWDMVQTHHLQMRRFFKSMKPHQKKKKKKEEFEY